MINITDVKAKQRLQRVIDRKITRLELIQIRTLTPIINRQFRESAKLVANSVTEIDSSVDTQRQALRQNFRINLTRTVNVFSQDMFVEIDKIKPARAIEKGAFEEFQQAIQAFIVKLTADRVTKVGNTTKKIIKNIIGRGVAEGISNRDIAKNILESGKITSNVRAIMIAKTETHTAAVKAMNQTMKASRLKFEHEWVSSKDDRTRTRLQGGFEHLDIFPFGPNFERIPENQQFVGTGIERLDFPGDPNGSAGNIINCRCVEIFHTV